MPLGAASWGHDGFSHDPGFLASQEELRCMLFTIAQSAAPTRAGESRCAGPRGGAGAGGRARTDATGALQCQASGILEELCRSGGSMGRLIKQSRHDEESRGRQIAVALPKIVRRCLLSF